MKCANPDCNAEGLYLRSGSLHALDFVIAGGQASGDTKVSRKIVWLCAKCTRQFEVETWRPPGQQLRPRNRDATPLPRVPQPRFEMRLAAQRLAS